MIHINISSESFCRGYELSLGPSQEQEIISCTFLQSYWTLRCSADVGMFLFYFRFRNATEEWGDNGALLQKTGDTERMSVENHCVCRPVRAELQLSPRYVFLCESMLLQHCLSVLTSSSPFSLWIPIQYVACIIQITLWTFRWMFLNSTCLVHVLSAVHDLTCSAELLLILTFGSMCADGLMVLCVYDSRA